MNKLIGDLKKQKARAQYKLYEKYSDYLFRVSFRYLNNCEDAQDVLSQSFIKIFDKIKEIDISEEVVLKAWMRKVVINQSLMALRKRKLFTENIEEIGIIEEGEPEADEKLLEEDIVKMLLDLPDGYRTVFSLYVIEGYKHEEIAFKLGISVGTSKSQLSKARKLLKEMIINTENKFKYGKVL